MDGRRAHSKPPCGFLMFFDSFFFVPKTNRRFTSVTEGSFCTVFHSPQHTHTHTQSRRRSVVHFPSSLSAERRAK